MQTPSLPKGTRDFYPEEMALREHIFTSWDRTCQRYGFEKWDAPLFEQAFLGGGGGVGAGQQVEPILDLARGPVAKDQGHAADQRGHAHERGDGNQHETHGGA